MNTRATLDVRHLPHAALDHRSPIWWGNLLLLTIETTMFVLLLAAYFYLRMNFESWPPPRVDHEPILYDSAPRLLLPFINLAVILLSLWPMILADRAALHRDARTTRIALAITVLVGLAAVALRFFEFRTLNFNWNDNAYGSITWTILAVHFAHLIVGTLENLVMALWVFLNPLDDKHARDIHIGAIYWYWIVGIWIFLFAILYFGPRVL